MAYLKAWQVQSETDPVENYKVTLWPGGVFKCGCPSWVFSKAPKPDCKHIVSLKNGAGAVMALEAPAAVFQALTTGLAAGRRLSAEGYSITPSELGAPAPRRIRLED